MDTTRLVEALCAGFLAAIGAFIRYAFVCYSKGKPIRLKPILIEGSFGAFVGMLTYAVMGYDYRFSDGMFAITGFLAIPILHRLIKRSDSMADTVTDKIAGKYGLGGTPPKTGKRDEV